MIENRPRVLICDDSPTYAAALRRVLVEGETISIVGVHTTAESAIAALTAGKPDLMTMDFVLPGIGGIEAIEQVMAAHPLPILMVSAHARGSAKAAAAIAAGALDAVGKADLDLADPRSPGAEAFRRRVRLLAHSPVIHHPRARLARAATIRRADGSSFAAIGVVASTGGPQALATLFSALPAGFSVPVFVVQHMSAGFTDGLATWLDSVSANPVRLACAGTTPTAGIWIAPEGSHLVLDRDHRLALDRRTAPGLHRPSGDVMLSSLAERFGARSIAVVLSGMGSDGAAGVTCVCNAGGVAIAQDEATSAIYGMPRAAAERGADFVLPLDEIGPMLVRLTGGVA